MATANGQAMTLPPQNLEAETAVLGSILLDPECLRDVLDVVRPVDFYGPDHQLLYAAMLSLWEKGEKIDAVTLTAHLQALGQLDKIGGTDLIVAIMERTPSAANAGAYAGVVAAAAERRREVAAGTEIVRLAHDPTSTTEELETARAKLWAVPSSRRPAFDLDASVNAALAEVDEALNPTLDGAMPTGIEPLDRNTGGLRRGHLWVIGGRPQHCKTAVAINIIDAALKRHDCVYNPRFEERPEDMLIRIASQRSGVPYSEVRSATGERNEYDIAALKRELARLRSDAAGLLTIAMYPTLAEIEREVQRLKPAILILDTLQKATHAVGQARAERHDLEVARLTAWLGRLAGNYNVAVIAISQIGRSMLRGNPHGLPRLEHLKESGSIEEDADVAVLCYWPVKEMLLGSGTPPGRFLLNLAKNRYAGLTGVLACGIDPGTQRLAGIASDEADAFLEQVRSVSGR